ncbi:hypothetical protein SAMN05443377_1184 [Propionibacterium cyclohexanicum]|uniref:Uncharacterized protein n=1 Tax=Propionibacterium cyclohexanicum TaxID=64702 RepID=A0A1H9T1V1_9ACTN|nr:hypothetical protein [Propionibacterium cyclohexanicum]SER91230.1 hypothetical protein SAMN05443377_1184 [Propionibacterium cyclohexanicum]
MRKISKGPWTRRPGTAVLLVTAVVLIAVIVSFVIWMQRTTSPAQDGATPTRTATPTPPPQASAGQPTREGLDAITDTRVVFGHQSIGMNILSAMPAVFSTFGLQAPQVASVDWPAARDTDSPVFAEIWVGTNGDPLGKISDFAAKIDAATHPYAIAFMKIGPLDITASTDVSAVFESYTSTMDALAQKHPQTTFVYTTVGLMTEEAGWSGVAASQVGVPATAGGSDNARREQYNALIRERFAASGRLFDVAQLQSELPDGRIATKPVDGVAVRVMNPAFSDDSLHLNAAGSQHLAAGMLAVIGRVATERASSSPR